MKHSIAPAMALATALALVGASRASHAAVPDLAGFWQPVQKQTALRTLDGKAPPLTAAAKAVYERRLAKARAGNRDFDNAQFCRPIGIPRLLAESAFELAQTSRQVLFLYEWNRLQRPMDIRAEHDAFDKTYPYYLGHPVASWDGDTLVVDSIYFNDDTSLDSTGLPHSDALHVVERYRLKDADTLESVVSIDDKKDYTATWQTRFDFKRMPAGSRLPEDVCEQRMNIKDLNSTKTWTADK